MRPSGAPRRIPVMHFVFAKMRLAEERGLGLKSMKSKALSAGIPLPSYSYEAPYVVLSLFKEAAAAIPVAAVDASEQLSEAERKGWTWLVTRATVTTAEYQEALSVPNRAAKDHLKKLTGRGAVMSRCITVALGRPTNRARHQATLAQFVVPRPGDPGIGPFFGPRWPDSVRGVS